MKLGWNQPISLFTFATFTLSQYGPLNLRSFFVKRWAGPSKASFSYSVVGRTALFRGLRFFLISTTSKTQHIFNFHSLRHCTVERTKRRRKNKRKGMVECEKDAEENNEKKERKWRNVEREKEENKKIKGKERSTWLCLSL